MHSSRKLGLIGSISGGSPGAVFQEAAREQRVKSSHLKGGNESTLFLHTTLPGLLFHHLGRDLVNILTVMWIGLCVILYLQS